MGQKKTVAMTSSAEICDLAFTCSKSLFCLQSLLICFYWKVEWCTQVSSLLIMLFSWTARYPTATHFLEPQLVCDNREIATITYSDIICNLNNCEMPITCKNLLNTTNIVGDAGARSSIKALILEVFTGLH